MGHSFFISLEMLWLFDRHHNGLKDKAMSVLSYQNFICTCDWVISQLHTSSTLGYEWSSYQLIKDAITFCNTLLMSRMSHSLCYNNQQQNISLCQGVGYLGAESKWSAEFFNLSFITKTQNVLFWEWKSHLQYCCFHYLS